MTTRKVTAIEEKVLALAVEWAEKREAWDRCLSADGSWGSAMKPNALKLKGEERAAEQTTLVAAKRLLKQRRPKGEKK